MATCYFPNGTADDSGTMKPCPLSSGKQHGMCCKVGNDDICQKDFNGQYTGFCLGGWDAALYRDGCTDRNWGPECLNVCTTGLGEWQYSYGDNLHNSYWPVAACGDGTYCCGQGTVASTCCAEGNGYYIVNVRPSCWILRSGC